MNNNDSLDRLLSVYMAAVAAKPFTYNHQSFEPRPLFVSPQLFQGFTCPAHCGACCFRVTLDYLPEDAHKNKAAIARTIVINEEPVVVLSDKQEDSEQKMCRNLDIRDGRCLIHGNHPFLCDLEFVRVLRYQDHAVLTQRLFGRGWALTRVDGETKGAACRIIPADPHTVAEVLRKLQDLQRWADHFKIETKVPAILEWVATRIDNQGMWFGGQKDGFFGEDL